MFLKQALIQSTIHGGLCDCKLIAKQPQTMTLSPPCFTDGMRFFSWIFVFSLRQTCPNSSGVQIITFWTLFQKFWSLSTFSQANFSLALMFLLESKIYLFAHLPCKVNICSLFLIVKTCTFTWTVARDCCRSCVEFFVDRFYHLAACSWGELAGTTRPGNVGGCFVSQWNGRFQNLFKSLTRL